MTRSELPEAVGAAALSDGRTVLEAGCPEPRLIILANNTRPPTAQGSATVSAASRSLGRRSVDDRLLRRFPSPARPEDPIIIRLRVLAHQASEGAGLDLFFEPDVLVAVGLTRRWEPVTETDSRPILVRQQDHDVGIVAHTHDPYVEVLGDSPDEWFPDRGSGR